MAEGDRTMLSGSADPMNLNGDHENRAKPVTGSLPMNGGNGTYSYSKNSSYQKESADLEKGKIIEEIEEKLDMKKLSSFSNTICLADLGCSTGPNTFMIIQEILEAMQRKHRSQLSQSCPKADQQYSDDHQMPEFQVFFNDLEANDFNTLFTSLPQDRKYFAAGVPGSFHRRLFPESSIHFVHTSSSLHWISKSPEVLQNKDSPAWNKGRIHYTSAPDEVVDAYAAQFAEDMKNFLNVRATELVPGGMMVMILSGIPKGMPYSEIPAGMLYNCISSSLMDMAKEGIIEESEVDSFNLPYYAASLEEMEEIVEKNGCFKIERMESSNPAAWLQNRPVDIPTLVKHVRAAVEGMFARHFGSEVMDEMFGRVTDKLLDISDLVNSRRDEKSQLLAVLKRK
ncbi:unnamed protein product [Malus baccata var. baccata]